MYQPLKLHPDSRCTAAARIDVEAARPRPGQLVLSYFVTGRIGDLRLPSLAEPRRTDGLWRQTCFEAFIRMDRGSAYYEFNFSPSRQWAVYGFDGYRSGMRTADQMGPPHVDVDVSENLCEMRVALDVDRLPGVADESVWRLGLSAIIEETNGRKSYWALKHPPGNPDFHHSHCFVLDLPAA